MAEIRTVTTLRRKREEIRRTIIAYEEKLSQAKADLSHVSAAVAIFEGASEGPEPRAYVDLERLFAYRELMQIAKAGLEAKGPMDTRQIVQHIMEAKGLPAGDKVLAKAIGGKIIHPLTQQWQRGRITTLGKRKGVRIWAMPEQNLL